MYTSPAHRWVRRRRRGRGPRRRSRRTAMPTVPSGAVTPNLENVAAQVSVRPLSLGDHAAEAALEGLGDLPGRGSTRHRGRRLSKAPSLTSSGTCSMAFHMVGTPATIVSSSSTIMSMKSSGWNVGRRLSAAPARRHAGNTEAYSQRRGTAAAKVPTRSSGLSSPSWLEIPGSLVEGC